MLTGAGLTTIGSYIGTNITVNAASTETPASSFNYSENSDGTITITEFTGSETEIVIPSQIKGKAVTSIGYGAFTGCSSLTNIVIPNSVTSIDRSAFSYCTGLTSITIPNSVTSIKDIVFLGCTGLTNITIPNSVTSVGYSTFYGCTNLTNVTIPNSVTSIGEWAFYDCKSLKSVTIPESATNISHYAFGYCDYAGVRKIDNFTIKGTAGSAAETYANENGFKFIDLNAKPVNSDSTISTTATTAGAKVTVTAGFTGGYAPYQYLYAYQKDSGAWKTIKGYSDASSADITLPSIGNYTIRIKCKDTEGKIVNKDFTVKVNDSKVVNNSTIDTTEIILGKSVKLTGAATGGTGSYTYAVFYKQASQTTWTKAQDYKSSITAAVTPKAATTYNIRVKVKDSAGKITNKDFTVKVNGKLANKSTIDKTTAKLGQSFDLTGVATGGTGGYTYAVFYKQASQTSWTKAQDYQSEITAAVTPKAATTYTIRVKLKDSNGTIVNKDFTVKVTK